MIYPYIVNLIVIHKIEYLEINKKLNLQFWDFIVTKFCLTQLIHELNGGLWAYYLASKILKYIIKVLNFYLSR
jgi:hypothetical protein